MFEFFESFQIENTQDLLNLSLSVSAICITFFLSIVLVRLFRVMGTLETLLQEIQETVELAQNYLWQPARIILAIKERFAGIATILKSFLSSKK